MDAELKAGYTIQKLSTRWALAGTDTVDAAPASVVSGVSVLTGRTERLYFDTATGLLVRRSVPSDGAFGSFSTDTYFENYWTIDGVTLPTMISEFTPDFGTVRKLNDVELNADLNAAIFARPTPPATGKP